MEFRFTEATFYIKTLTSGSATAASAMEALQDGVAGADKDDP